MTTQDWTKRIALSGAGVVGVASVVEVVTSVLGVRDHGHVQEFRRDSGQVLIYFPGLAMDARATSEDFLPMFDQDSVLLVDYPRSGYNREATFSLLAGMIERYRGKPLTLLGVSMGTFVALDFRRYLLENPATSVWFPEVKFIFLSSVTRAADVNIHLKWVPFLGFVLRGGIISDQLWRAFSSIRRAFPGIMRFRTEYGEAKYRELEEILSRISIRMLASELRAVQRSRGSRQGEFEADAALIFSYNRDDVAKPGCDLTLADSFGNAELLEILDNGHADIRMAVASGKFEPAVKRFLAS